MKVNPADSQSSKGRTLLKDKAYQALKQQILSDRYPPGSALAERRLAEELGMSKTPVKAALERLELEGYITIAPQQFVRVRELETSDISEQYEVRTAIESYVVRRLAGRLTDEQKARLAENLGSQRELADSAAAIEQQVAVDAAFHLMLAEMLGNQSLFRIMSELQDRIYRVIMRVLKRNPERFVASVQEHERIAEALLRGDGELAAKMIEDHLSNGRSIILG